MFIPTPDSQLVVSLPGETMRARVVRVLARDVVLVEIGQPLRPTHHYRRGDIIACRREISELGERWEAVDDRLMFQASPDWDAQNRKPARKPRAAKPAAAPAKRRPKAGKAGRSPGKAPAKPEKTPTQRAPDV